MKYGVEQYIYNSYIDIQCDKHIYTIYILENGIYNVRCDIYDNVLCCNVNVVQCEIQHLHTLDAGKLYLRRKIKY